MPKHTFYAVVKDGVKTVVYTWKECESLTKGIKGVTFKGFDNRQEADAWSGKYEAKLSHTPRQTPPDRTQYPQQLAAAIEKKHAIIYTDAAYLSHIRFAGIGIYSETLNLKIHEKLEFDEYTSQRAELFAISKALNHYKERRADYPSGLTLFTDSQWSVNTLTVWPATWERKRIEYNLSNPKQEQTEWKVYSGATVKHLDIIYPALELIATMRESGCEINITWISRNHNEKADSLSRGNTDV